MYDLLLHTEIVKNDFRHQKAEAKHCITSQKLDCLA